MDRIKEDYRRAPLEEKTRRLLDFAVQMTRDVHSIGRQTVEELRRLGWSDEAILQAAQIAGFFNYYTRLVEALGVEPEDFMEPALHSWKGRREKPERT